MASPSLDKIPLMHHQFSNNGHSARLDRKPLQPVMLSHMNGILASKLIETHGSNNPDWSVGSLRPENLSPSKNEIQRVSDGKL